MKKTGIKQLLDPDDNYDSFYNSDKNDNQDDRELPRGFDSWDEVAFYGTEDLDFMRFHKRTKNNMQEVLQDIILGNK